MWIKYYRKQTLKERIVYLIKSITILFQGLLGVLYSIDLETGKIIKEGRRDALYIALGYFKYAMTPTVEVYEYIDEDITATASIIYHKNDGGI